MPTNPNNTSKDDEHLKLLSIFHYVVGGISCFFACIPLLHVVIGLFIIIASGSINGKGGEAPPQFMGWLFLIMGSTFFIVGQIMAIAVILSGWFISKRKYYLYSFVVACVLCLFCPFGTVLGVFTIIVLSRESVKETYQHIKMSQ